MSHGKSETFESYKRAARKILLWKAVMILLFCIYSFPVFCETTQGAIDENTTTFVKKIQNTGSLIQTIQATHDSFVSLSRRSKDFVIRKSGASGNTVWERSLRLKTKDKFTLNAIVQTSSGAYVAVGSLGECPDYYYFCPVPLKALVVKLHPNGVPVWSTLILPKQHLTS
jgi:hypothetical protein